MTVLDWLGINIATLIVSVFLFLGWTHCVDSQYEDDGDDE